MNPPLTPGQLNGRVFKTSGQILCGVKGTNHFRIFYKFIQIKKKKRTHGEAGYPKQAKIAPD